MFRQMRRFKQQVSDDVCKNILQEEKRGVLSVLGDDGYPYGIVLDYYYDSDKNKIYFHGAKEGHKIDSLKKCNKCSFVVMNKGYKEDNSWIWHITSVVCFGKIRFVNDRDEFVPLLRKIGNKYYPNKSIKSCEITYYDSLGSYKNLSEYDENKHLIKLSEIYDDFKTETFYDENDCIIKFVEKDAKNNIKSSKQYINKDGECIKTIVKDGLGNERYHIDHLRKNKSNVLKNINVFLFPNNNLIGKEFIIQNNESGVTKFIYTNKDGKRIKYEALCDLLGDDI
jgi:nitroimidazol reductase NimA-like FMN-containing flavoprotein (pyridoxamine 5'-phosphate oxidase superfamily)